MIRVCDDEDWEYVPLERRPLGAYDDVDHSTLCPHAPLPPPVQMIYGLT